jgi:hypothetical protein
MMTACSLIFWLGLLVIWGVFIFHAMFWLDEKVDFWIDKLEKRWFSAKNPYFWDNR